MTDLSDFSWGSNEIDPSFAQMLYHELFVDRVYEKHFGINEGDIVLDAGANVGGFTRSILQYNPKHVYCVEPSTSMLETLEKNLVGLDNVTIIPKAIDYSEIDGKTIPSMGVYLYQHDSDVYNTTTLKKIVSDYNIERIDFLKFDCEGGEYAIFSEENVDWIKNNVKHAAGEWHINDHENAVERFIKFRDLYLVDAKFRLYERCGTERTEDIFNDDFVQSFADWWKPTQMGQFMIYIENFKS
jgi:FkbM family methyltransferase